MAEDQPHFLPHEAEPGVSQAPDNAQIREGLNNQYDQPGASEEISTGLGDLVVPAPHTSESTPAEAPDATAPALDEGGGEPASEQAAGDVVVPTVEPTGETQSDSAPASDATAAPESEPGGSEESAADSEDQSAPHSDEASAEKSRNLLGFLDQSEDEQPPLPTTGLGFLSSEAAEPSEQTGPAGEEEGSQGTEAPNPLDSPDSEDAQEAAGAAKEASAESDSPYEEVFAKLKEAGVDVDSMPASAFMEVVKDYDAAGAKVKAALDSLASAQAEVQAAEDARQAILTRYATGGTAKTA